MTRPQLSCEHEGLCSGIEISHVLYREGTPIQENVEKWGGAAQGQTRVSLQTSDGQPFPEGSYEVTVTIAGGEPEHARFTVGEIVKEVEESRLRRHHPCPRPWGPTADPHDGG